MRLRLRVWLWQMILCLDQFVSCWLRGWWFVWVGGECPSSEETISSFVGRKSAAGYRWAHVAEKIIDAVMGKGHCRRSIEHPDEWQRPSKPNP